MSPGLYVRLKNAYIVKCESFEKNSDGTIREIRCTYIPESRSGHDTSGIKTKSVIHWAEAHTCISIQINNYDRLFKVENPSAESGDFKEYINPDSLLVISGAFAEPALKQARFDDRYQFIRKGYFCLDKDSSGRLVFNRTVGLKDNWKLH